MVLVDLTDMSATTSSEGSRVRRCRHSRRPMDTANIMAASLQDPVSEFLPCAKPASA